jgi:hypothetical protein
MILFSSPQQTWDFLARRAPDLEESAISAELLRPHRYLDPVP